MLHCLGLKPVALGISHLFYMRTATGLPGTFVFELEAFYQLWNQLFEVNVVEQYKPE